MPKDFEAIALSQSETLNKQAEHIRQLIRERDAEKSNAEAAYDMAEQYARKVGVDISRDDVLKYVEVYWQNRGDLERRGSELETFRWDVFQIHHELSTASPSQLDSTTSADLAAAVVRRIDATNRSGAPRKKLPLFPRPQVPGI